MMARLRKRGARLCEMKNLDWSKAHPHRLFRNIIGNIRFEIKILTRIKIPDWDLLQKNRVYQFTHGFEWGFKKNAVYSYNAIRNYTQEFLEVFQV